MHEQAQLEEYKMLRNDIQQRINFRFQLFNLLLVALAAILSIGLEKKNPDMLLVYPILSFFLTMSWIHQSVVMVKLARYLRDELEPKIPGLVWESYIQKDFKRFSSFSFIGMFANSGFILFSQALTLSLAFISIEVWNTFTVFLGIVACISTLLTLFFLIVYSRMKR